MSDPQAEPPPAVNVPRGLSSETETSAPSQGHHAIGSETLSQVLNEERRAALAKVDNADFS
jgi:hypothetical protein